MAYNRDDVVKFNYDGEVVGSVLSHDRGYDEYNIRIISTKSQWYRVGDIAQYIEGSWLSPANGAGLGQSRRGGSPYPIRGSDKPSEDFYEQLGGIGEVEQAVVDAFKRAGYRPSGINKDTGERLSLISSLY